MAQANGTLLPNDLPIQSLSSPSQEAFISSSSSAPTSQHLVSQEQQANTNLSGTHIKQRYPDGSNQTASILPADSNNNPTSDDLNTQNDHSLTGGTGAAQDENSMAIMGADKSTVVVASVERHNEIPHTGEEGYFTGRTTPSTAITKSHSEEPGGGRGSFSRPGTLRADSSYSSGVASSIESDPVEGRPTSRSMEKKSLLSKIKKTFSFNRSRSTDPRSHDFAPGTHNTLSSRSVSADTRPGKHHSASATVSREPSMTRADIPSLAVNNQPLGGAPTNNNGHSSYGQSLSNLSEISGYSNRTFVHDNSTLVVEMEENGLLKHYVVPASLANKSKWRKRGVKLHIYNDHTFKAKHFTGSIDCSVCSKPFSRRPGKQGYECRDCNLAAHKRCHILVETRCPSSRVHDMELEYVADPKVVRNSKRQIEKLQKQETVDQSILLTPP